MFYCINAEHVCNKQELIMELAKERIEVMVYGDDPTFDSMFVLVIVGTKSDVEKAQEIVWKYNCGAYAGIRELTEAEYDEMC